MRLRLPTDVAPPSDAARAGGLRGGVACAEHERMYMHMHMYMYMHMYM